MEMDKIFGKIIKYILIYNKVVYFLNNKVARSVFNVIYSLK